jgi:hypothetical protein
MTVAQAPRSLPTEGDVLRPTRPLSAAAVAVVACGWILFPASAHVQGWSPYGWYPPFAFGFGRPYSSLRLQISPRDTEVFVDGYYAGIVDDFDGFMQRLHLEPGQHTIQLYLTGHRTAEQQIYLQPGGTLRIRHVMEPLAPGETAPARPTPASRPSQQPTPSGAPPARENP